MTQQPLKGVRVIDLTHALAGPFCTHHLHLMGAEVIKIEPPHGDDFRARPAAFAACNAGKRSVTLDLKSDEGRGLLLKLVRTGDVLVENYRPGVAAKLGLSWEALRAENPRLVYASISGFGQTGPLKDMPAIESSVQAASGLMRAQVKPEDHPRKTPMLLLDPLSGYVAYAAILAALLQRGATGEGQRLDIAMSDAALMIASVAVAEAQLDQPAPPSPIVGRPTVARVRAKDRELFISAVQPAWWLRVCDVAGRPELKDDARVATPAARVANADALLAEWEQGLASRPAAEWEAELGKAGVPAGVVRTVAEFVGHPHAVGRRVTARVRAPGYAGPVELMGAGVSFATGGPAFQGDVPELGADTDAVLGALGVTAAELTRLRESKVI